MDMIRSLAIVAVLAVPVTPARSEDEPKKEEIPYRRLTIVTVTIPKDHRLLVALDQGRPGSIVLPGTPVQDAPPDAPKAVGAKEAGVDPLLARTVRLDAALTAEILDPLRLRPLVKRHFKIDLKWEEKRNDENMFIGEALQAKVEARWSLGGGFGLTYVDDVLLEPLGLQVKDEPGVRKGLRMREKPIPSATLAMVPTGVEGLSYGRIPYTEVDGATHAVVVFWARDLEKMSKCVRVSKEDPEFAWTEKWFSDIAEPSLNKP